MIFQLRTHRDLFVSNESDAISTEADGSGASMSARAAFIVLITTTVLVSFCAEALVSSIDGLVESSNLSKRFIGLILIPIVSNAAEHATACVVAIKNKMDLVRQIILLHQGSTDYPRHLVWSLEPACRLHFLLHQCLCFWAGASVNR